MKRIIHTKENCNDTEWIRPITIPEAAAKANIFADQLRSNKGISKYLTKDTKREAIIGRIEYLDSLKPDSTLDIEVREDTVDNLEKVKKTIQGGYSL